jgi:hypothetical protein
MEAAQYLIETDATEKGIGSACTISGQPCQAEARLWRAGPAAWDIMPSAWIWGKVGA